MISIYFAKIKEDAVIPTKRDEDAGYDLFASFEQDYLIIRPNETAKIPLGIASCFPSNYCMIVKERGSTGILGIGQRSGVIDSGYRNEWILPITNHSNCDIIIAKEYFIKTLEYKNLIRDRNCVEYNYRKAIAQALLIPVPLSESVEIKYEELVEFKSHRMFDGFGSTNMIKEV